MSKTKLVQKVVEHLAAVPNRGATLAGEKETANFVISELDSMGYDTSSQVFFSPPKAGYIVCLIFGSAVAGSITGFYYPLVGLLTLLASWWLSRSVFDMKSQLYEYLVPTGKSINAVGSKTNPEAIQNIVFMGHLDTGQAGIMFHPMLKKFFARLNKGKKNVQGPMVLPHTMIIICAATLLLLVLGVQGTILFGMQIFFLVFFILGLLINIQWVRAPHVPGAVDNATGVAAVLFAAQTLKKSPLKKSNLYFVGTGSEESGLKGATQFIKSHKDEFEKNATYFINFESIGAGTLQVVESEGLLGRLAYPPLLNGLAQHIAVKKGYGPLPTVALQAGTDTAVSALAGLHSLCFIALDELGLPPNYHEMSDTPEGIDYDLVERAAEIAIEVCRELER